MPAVIEVQDVGLRRDGRNVLQGVSFSIAEQELVGLIGPNGGGKTTLLQVLLGVTHPDRGRVQVLGRDPWHANGGRRAIGYVAQSKNFDRGFPARAKDVVMMGNFGQIGLFRLPAAKDKDRVMASLARVGMRDRADRPIGRLSGGEQQRVFIAQALVAEPQLLILDEPTAGVDREGEESLIELLTELKVRSALTILMVSHNVSLIRSHTDRILCHNRELYFSGEADGLTDAVIAQTYHRHPEDGGD